MVEQANEYSLAEARRPTEIPPDLPPTVDRNQFYENLINAINKQMQQREAQHEDELRKLQYEIRANDRLAIRRQYACAALTGLLAAEAGAHIDWPNPHSVAKYAFQIADAMLVEEEWGK